MTLFYKQFEDEAIERIRKFARLSEKMGYIPVKWLSKTALECILGGFLFLVGWIIG